MEPQRFNISTLLDRNLDAGRAGKVAIYHGDDQVTYGDLHERACAMGRALRALGVRREERVLLVLDDSPAFPVAFLGAARIGAVPVNVNPLLRSDDYGFFLDDSYARVVVADQLTMDRVRPALTGREDVTLISADEGVEGAHLLPDLLAEHAGELVAVDTHNEDPAFWLYSSGSTGRPKGVVHLHQNLVVTCEQYGEPILQITADDVTFSSTKLFHAYGLGNGLSFPYWVGASTVLMSGRPTPDSVLDTAERFRPTLFFSVPTLYNAMLRSPGAAERDLSSVRLCVSAAETLPGGVWKRWNEMFGLTILDGIGSTEMLHIYCSNTPAELRPGSSGKAVPGYELKLLGIEGEALGPGEPGNLYVSGGSSLASYWHRRAKTKQSLQGEWFFTGDRYRVDDEGFYWYEGRADDMMKIGGLWVSPVDVENVLIDHPGVAEVALVGVAVDGFARIKAFVVPAAEGKSEEFADELRAWCKERLQRYQYPHVIEFCDELPKTTTGKIQRYKLRESG